METRHTMLTLFTTITSLTALTLTSRTSAFDTSATISIMGEFHNHLGRELTSREPDLLTPPPSSPKDLHTQLARKRGSEIHSSILENKWPKKNDDATFSSPTRYAQVNNSDFDSSKRGMTETFSPKRYELEINPDAPPDYMRVRVIHADEGEKTLVLYKTPMRTRELYSKAFYENGTVTHITGWGPVRTYQGWCEEDADSSVVASVIPSGELRWHIFRTSCLRLNCDLVFIPNSDYKAAPQEIVINYQIIFQGDNDFGDSPKQPSGTPKDGFSWVESAPGLSDTHSHYVNGLNVAVEFQQSEFEYADLWKESDAPKSELERQLDLIRQAEFKLAIMSVPLTRDLHIDLSLDAVFFRPEVTLTLGEMNDIFKNSISEEDYEKFDSILFTGTSNDAPTCPIRDGNSFASSEHWTNPSHDMWNHMLGHLLGSHDCYHGCPTSEGRSFMNGNHLTRYEKADMIQMRECTHRNEGIREDFGPRYNYSDPDRYVQQPPYAQYDHVITAPLSPVVIDPLSNDHDANNDMIAISGIADAVTVGHEWEIKLSGQGSAAEGHDTFVVTPYERIGSELVEYVVTDLTGRVSHGIININVMKPESLVLYLNMEDVEEERLIEQDCLVRDHSGNNHYLSERGLMEYNVTTPWGKGIKFNGGVFNVNHFDFNEVMTWSGWFKTRGTKRIYGLFEHRYRDDKGYPEYFELIINDDFKLAYRYKWSFKFSHLKAHEWAFDEIVIAPKKWYFISLTFTLDYAQVTVLSYEDVYGKTDGADGTDDPWDGEQFDIPNTPIDSYQIQRLDCEGERNHTELRKEYDTQREAVDDRGFFGISSGSVFMDEVRVFRDLELTLDEIKQIARYGDSQVRAVPTPFHGAHIRRQRAKGTPAQPIGDPTVWDSITLEWPSSSPSPASVEPALYTIWHGNTRGDLKKMGTTHDNAFVLPFDQIGVVVEEEGKDWCFKDARATIQNDMVTHFWCVSDGKGARVCDKTEVDSHEFMHFQTIYEFNVFSSCNPPTTTTTLSTSLTSTSSTSSTTSTTSTTSLTSTTAGLSVTTTTAGARPPGTSVSQEHGGNGGIGSDVGYADDGSDGGEGLMMEVVDVVRVTIGYDEVSGGYKLSGFSVMSVAACVWGAIHWN
eukprot:GHVN01012909.1.p1 GENE.GHVN01012909.1~~GHVN01012909.1.p1  ORF type:complete len:1123 (-),score=208.23 GHVN01012909.1:1034-4402(-)